MTIDPEIDGHLRHGFTYLDPTQLELADRVRWRDWTTAEGGRLVKLACMQSICFYVATISAILVVLTPFGPATNAMGPVIWQLVAITAVLLAGSLEVTLRQKPGYRTWLARRTLTLGRRPPR